MQVVASVYPVQQFVQAVGGDRVEVFLLVPPGVEPHDWEPTGKDLARIKGGRILFYHGAGLEHWVPAMLKPGVLGQTKAVEVSRGIPLLPAEAGGHAQGEAEEEAHGGDPHLWLDPVLAQAEVKNVLAALCEEDPAHRGEYEQNAAAYLQQLQLLHQEYESVLQGARRRELVTSHAAFAYLAKRYQLQQVSVMGLAPETEPTADRMAEIVRFCRQHQARYIFTETLVSPKLAEVLSREAGVSVLVLNPLEGLTEEETRRGQTTYLSLMRDNLQQLRRALVE